MKKNTHYTLKAPLEAFTRQIIENKLRSLNYNMDEMDPNCNIYRERAKYNYQDDLLNGKNPDFLIYKANSSEILAVIEAKRPGISLEKAIEQAIELYALPLNIPIIFVYNSGSFYACTKERKSIKIDSIEINDFVDEKTLIQLIEGNFEIDSFPEGFSISRAELLSKFKTANNLLRKAGLRDGYERFSVFSDLMFLKLKNDFDDIGEVSANNTSLDKNCNWKKLIEKTPSGMGKDKFKLEESEVKTYLEDTIKKKLYEVYGDVFESSLNINDENILIQLIELIETIPFKGIDSDVKGDAFEFFLRNVTNGNKDLGEYYTPRHIVKMIIKLINPSFGEKIYDPCCGTGGFLLECFKYLRNNTDVTIYPEDSSEIIKEKKSKRKIIREESIFGREITSTARIAKMNMILFGDGHTHIRKMDSLKEPVDEKYDVVVSNIPYSQNKLEHGNLYIFPTDKGDSLFMQHIWRSVKSGGRIAVVVPDTFLYSKDTYNIRRKIIEESNRMIVVSLPRGVFNPYTPTKTSIIFAWKKRSSIEKLNEVSMYIIRNDGFELGARRRPLPGQSDCNKFLMDYNHDKELRNFKTPNSIDVPIEEIVKNYDLLPFQFMEHLPVNRNNLISLHDIILQRKEIFNIEEFENKDQECTILSVTQNGIYSNEVLSVSELSELNQTYKRVYPGDFVYNPHRINVGSIGVVPPIAQYMYVSNIYPTFTIKDTVKVPNYYLQKILKSNEYKTIINDYCIGGARADLKIERLEKIKIALPDEKKRKKINQLSKEIDAAYNKYLELLKQINEDTSDSLLNKGGKVIVPQKSNGYNHSSLSYQMIAEPFEIISIDDLNTINPNDFFINYLIGYYRSQDHLQWILKNRLYNIPLDNRQGVITSRKFFKEAQVLILYGPSSDKQIRLFLLKNPRELKGKDLNNLSYPNAKDANLYGVYDIEDLLDPPQNFKEIFNEVKEKLGRRNRKPLFTTSETPEKLKDILFYGRESRE